MSLAIVVDQIELGVAAAQDEHRAGRNLLRAAHGDEQRGQLVDVAALVRQGPRRRP